MRSSRYQEHQKTDGSRDVNREEIGKQIELAYNQRDFYEEVHVNMMQQAPEPIPEQTMKRLDALAFLMDRETRIIDRLTKELEQGD